MTALQNQLIENLAARKIDASFNGDFLSGSSFVIRKGRKQKQPFSIRFDDGASLEGPAVVDSSLRKTYSEAFARDAFFESILLGQGHQAAVDFANECREAGIRIGASQDWIDAHAGELTPVAL